MRFGLIEASAGLDVFLRQGTSALSTMMQSLVALHSVTSLQDIPRYQPLMKVTPRLSQSGQQVLAPIVSRALDELRGLPEEARVIHGDLHANQFLIEEDRECWIIDLDDLAIGDPAADLGNFAAHLATRPETAGDEPLHSMQQWLAQALHEYHKAGGSVLAQSADAYGRIALVRRALKLQEARPDTFSESLMLSLRAAS